MRACLVSVVALSAGCAWTPKPYASDPLIRTRTALPGDPVAVPPAAAPEMPQPPEPPAEERLAATGPA